MESPMQPSRQKPLKGPTNKFACKLGIKASLTRGAT